MEIKDVCHQSNKEPVSLRNTSLSQHKSDPEIKCCVPEIPGASGGAAAAADADTALQEAAAILRVPAERLTPDHLLQLGDRLTVPSLDICYVYRMYRC